MTLVTCVDDRMGLQFNARRQSQDRVLRQTLLDMVPTSLYMSPYSGKMFGEDEKIVVSEDYLTIASTQDWVFSEDNSYLSCSDKIDRILLFRWNRHYPADMHFTFPGEWRLVSAEDFPGSSHEKITMEIYEK